MKALESGARTQSMLTSEIQDRANRLSGTKIPPYSVYQALRTLVKRKIVKSSRKGREYTFRLTSGETEPMPTAPEVEAPMPPAPELPVSDAPSPTVHTTLVPGEVAILHVGESHIETATNEHGKIVLERHKRPRA